MPTQDKVIQKKKKQSRKGKGKKGETYKDKAKTYKFRVVRPSSSGDKLAVELSRQQFAAIQAERDKAEKDKREAEKIQKEQMDALKAEAERERKQAEKFSKSYEPTMINILDLYRSLAKDPVSFTAEQKEIAKNISQFKDVLTTVGMNPEVAQVKATEASLQDLLEKRKEKEKIDADKYKFFKEQVNKTLLAKKWPDGIAKQLASIKVDLDYLKPDEVVKRASLLNQMNDLVYNEYKRRGWTEEEIRAKASYGLDVNNLNFTKPTKFFDGTPVSKPMVEEEISSLGGQPAPGSEEKEEYPLFSGSIGPPPLIETPPPPPFPGSKPMEEEEISLLRGQPAPGSEEKAQSKEIVENQMPEGWNTFWSTLPSREEKQEYPIVPPMFTAKEFPSFPNVSQASKSLADLSKVPLLPLKNPITPIQTAEPKKTIDISVFPAPYPPISTIAPSVADVPVLAIHAPPFSQESLTAATKATKPKEKETKIVEPFPLPPYQPPPYKEPPYKPFSPFNPLEGLQVYDPSEINFSRTEPVNRPKEKYIIPHDESSVKKQRRGGDGSVVLSELPPTFQFQAPFQAPENMVFDIGNPFGSY